MEAKINTLERRADDFDKWRNTVDVKLAVNEEQEKQTAMTLGKIDRKQDKLFEIVQADRIKNKEGSTKLTMIYSGCLVLLGTLLHSVIGKLSIVLLGGGNK